MNKSSYFILGILFFFLFSGCGEEPPGILPSGNTIKIGVVGPMSGPHKAMGEDSLEGVRTALHMNAYLDNGDGIKLIVEDDQNDPKLTVKAFRKLADSDNVSAIILLSSSASALSVNDIADTHKVPVMVLLATHQEISKNTKFVSQICFDNTFQGKVAALFVRDELLIQRVAVFKNPDSFYSSSLAEEFINTFRSLDGQVIEIISIDSNSMNFNYEEKLQSLREKNVQFLYLPLAAQDVITIYKAARNMAWDLEAMGGDNLLVNDFVLTQDNASYLDQLLTIDLYSNTIEKTSYGKQATKVYTSLYEAKNSTFPASGFEGMLILMNAINRCDDPKDRECINAMLHNTINFEGLIGKISISSNGKAQRPLIVNRFHDGRLEFVVKVY